MSIPLPQHPRPDFERKEWLNLNGTWKFKFDKENVGKKEAWFNSDDFPLDILVPFGWGSPLSGARAWWLFMPTRLGAPVTIHSSSLVAPSPSPAIMRQRAMVTVLRAFINRVKSGPSAVISSFPASPFASKTTVSLVDVSPSTLT